MNKSKGFVIQDEFVLELLESEFTAKEIGTLIVARVCYRTDRDLPKMDRATKMVWECTLRKYIDADMVRYDNVCERNKANAKSRWSKTKDMPDDTSGMPNKSEILPDMPNTKNKIQNTNIESAPKKAKPRSSEEVADYRRGLGYDGFDAQRFFDFYERNGWVQGKGKPIKDWKAAVRNWHSRTKEYAPKQTESWLDFAMREGD